MKKLTTVQTKIADSNGNILKTTKQKTLIWWKCFLDFLLFLIITEKIDLINALICKLATAFTSRSILYSYKTVIFNKVHRAYKLKEVKHPVNSDSLQ